MKVTLSIKLLDCEEKLRNEIISKIYNKFSLLQRLYKIFNKTSLNKIDDSISFTVSDHTLLTDENKKKIIEPLIKKCKKISYEISSVTETIYKIVVKINDQWYSYFFVLLNNKEIKYCVSRYILPYYKWFVEVEKRIDITEGSPKKIILIESVEEFSGNFKDSLDFVLHCLDEKTYDDFISFIKEEFKNYKDFTLKKLVFCEEKEVKYFSERKLTIKDVVDHIEKILRYIVGICGCIIEFVLYEESKLFNIYFYISPWCSIEKLKQNFTEIFGCNISESEKDSI